MISNEAAVPYLHVADSFIIMEVYLAHVIYAPRESLYETWNKHNASEQ